MKSFDRYIPLLSASSLLACFSSTLYAAPGELSTQPLTFVQTVEPNIMLLLDDSASMGADQVITNAGQSIRADEGDVVTVDGTNKALSHDLVENDDQLYALCAGYNALAYNPKVEYKPWTSISDTTSDPNSPFLFDNKTLTTALSDPIDATSTVDLSDHIYIKWNDSNNNDVLEAGECGPELTQYDNTITKTMPLNGSDTVEESSGVFYDSGGNLFNYSREETSTLTIDVGGDTLASNSGTLTLTITTFNVDNVDNTITVVDGKNTYQTGSTRNNGDRLLVYTGANTAAVTPFNSITTASGKSVTDVFNYQFTDPDDRSLNSPYVLYNVTANDNQADERRVKELVIAGSEAHLQFISDDNPFTRQGFNIAWKHSSDTDDAVNGDGVVTASDCDSRPNDCVVVNDDLPATVSTDPDLPYNTQQNYANWYTYYRTRDYVAKQALGVLIDSSDYRVGLATINDRGNGGAIVRDMSTSNSSYNKSTSIHGDKDSLLKQVYMANTAPNKKGSGVVNDGTNLRQLLDNAGRYFHENLSPDSNFLGTDTSNTTAVSAQHTSEHNDGFVLNANTPLFTEAKGGQCQQNFALLVTDGAWNGDISLDDAVGNADADVNNGDTIGAGITILNSDYDGGNYGDTYQNTLADFSMHYFENDLSSTLDDELSVKLHGQTIPHQHMVTFGVGFGVSGTITKDPEKETVTWTEPTAGDQRIDDLLHASYNGRGGYYSASNPEALQQSLDTIIQEINVRVSNTATGVSLSSYQLDNGALRYDVSYRPDGWWGDMNAYEFQNGSFSDTALWSADEQMSARSNRATDRSIITFNGQRGVPFSAPANYTSLHSDTDTDAGHVATLSSVQVNDLLSNAPHSASTLAADEIAANQAYLSNIIDYLRGDPSYEGASEGTSFRNRNGHYLGALIHSQPVYVSRPENNYPDTIAPSAYSDFSGLNGQRFRRPIVYVGGNDGMLHAFYASSTYLSGIDSISGYNEYTTDSENVGGKELFAYVPQIVSDNTKGGKKLDTLANEDFESTPYVDGGITVADVYVDKKNDQQARWRTYLVGALRSGGKGIYVLDITNPDNPNDPIHPFLGNAGEDNNAQVNAEDIVVKEFTHDDLNFVYGKPIIAKMNNDRWAAVIPNGYTTTEDGSTHPGDGTAKMFVVYLDEPKGENVAEGIYNNGYGDYSIIEASQNVWPSTQTCIAGGSCTLSELKYVQARYASDVPGDTSLNYAYQLLSSTFSCDEALFGSIAGYTLQNCYVSESDINGLSEPTAIDTDSNGTADRIYAGDLHGNLWVFDVSGSLANQWEVDDDNVSSNDPLFTATMCETPLVNGTCQSSEIPQPITTAPVITSHPSQSDSTTSPNTLVFFGTGQYLTVADKTTTHRQSFYGIWDAGQQYRSLNRDLLTEQTFTHVIGNSGTEGRVGSNNTLDYYTEGVEGVQANYGWYVDYPTTRNETDEQGNPIIEYKERTIINPVVLGRAIVFASFVPNEGSCNASSGYSYLSALQLETGAQLPFDFFNEEYGDDSHLSGIRFNGAIVGLEVIRNQDGNNELHINRDDGSVDSIAVKADDEDVKSGRKSWSILH